MTVNEALAMVKQVGAIEICGGNLRLRFPEKERDRLQPALYTLRRCKAEALAMMGDGPSAQIAPRPEPEEAGVHAVDTVPEPPDSDWDRDELELISSIKDGSVRDEVIAFKNILGGPLSPAGRPGKFVSAAQYQEDMLDGLFAKHRRLQEQQYAGLTLEEKEGLARQAEAAEKAAARVRHGERGRK